LDVTINHAGDAGIDSGAPATNPQRVNLNEPVQITSDEGHVLTLQRPELLGEYDFVEAVGPELSKNQTWLGMAMPLIFVCAIDGKPVAKPRSLREVKALITRLGHDGMTALTKWVAEQAQAAANAGADEDKVKNS
jgi:hypothetical protein